MNKFDVFCRWFARNFDLDPVLLVFCLFVIVLAVIALVWWIISQPLFFLTMILLLGLFIALAVLVAYIQQRGNRRN